MGYNEIDYSKCCVKGCSETATVRGFCRLHYGRVMTGKGDVRGERPKPERVVSKCSVDGCNHTAAVRGLCSYHYQRMRRKGELVVNVRDVECREVERRCRL